MKTKYVDILGSKYTIMLDMNEEDMDINSDCIMDYSMKLIKIVNIVPCDDSVKNLDMYRKKVLRHEIIHAFLYESGLWSNTIVSNDSAWAVNEEIIDWIALQFPKMLQAFKQADCIDI